MFKNLADSLAAQANPKCPTELPHLFNVLDYFYITDLWFEIRDGITISCVRYQLIDSSKSWWTSAGAPTLSVQGPAITTLALNRCTACRNDSKEIFNRGWACLRPDCKEFFKFSNGNDNEHELKYTQAFLDYRPPFTGSPIRSPLISPPLQLADVQNFAGLGFEIRCKKGVVCPDCRCCSRLKDWTRWDCENKCGWKGHNVPQVKVTMDMIKKSQKARKPNVCQLPVIKKSAAGLKFYQYDVEHYYFPGDTSGNSQESGGITVLRSNDSINAQKYGPNHIFSELQEAKMDMKRNPAFGGNSKSAPLPPSIISNILQVTHRH